MEVKERMTKDRSRNERNIRKLRTEQELSSSQRRSREAVSRRTPPVVSRNAAGINAAVWDERPLPRRRYDVPLSSPGAEIRLPSVPAVRNRSRILSGLLSGIFLLSLILLLNTPFFTVEKVEVKGARRFTSEEISRAINARGLSSFLIDPEEITQDLLLTYPGLKDVQVDIHWPAEVSIEIAEREPVLAWNYDDHVRWVDDVGVAFESHGTGMDIVVVNSTVLPPTLEHHFVDPQLVQAAVVLREVIPQEATLEYDQNRGLGWRDPRGWKVYFGRNTDELNEKLVIYRSITETLESKGIQPQLISVEYVDGPYIRMEH